MDKKNKNKGRTIGDIYKKVNHNKYSQITEISGSAELKSNYNNFFINYKFIIITILIIVICLLIYTFRNNLILVVYSLGLLLVLFLFSLYNCTYKLKINDKSLNLQVNFQKIEILAGDLINIYLSREKIRFFGLPIYSYSLNIMYLFNQNPTAISLPTVMANRKQLMRLFSTFKTKVLKDEEEEVTQEEETRRKIIKIVTIILLVALLIASIIIAIESVVNH